MSAWTHLVCDKCYAVLEPGREPFRLKEAPAQPCCRCGETTTSGIYYRAASETMTCGDATVVHGREV